MKLQNHNNHGKSQNSLPSVSSMRLKSHGIFTNKKGYLHPIIWLIVGLGVLASVITVGQYFGWLK